MIKFYKILFLNSLILGTLISISSFSWLSMWMGLEINLLSMIPIMTNNKNIFCSEAMMKYFISQNFASMILIFSILSTMNTDTNFYHLILNMSLLMKMGSAPFHFWFPQVMEGLSWNNSLIMLTWQKIAPFILISYLINYSIFFLIVIIFSSIIGSIQGLNQISLRKILSFSSINHISWMISCLLNSLILWFIYFMIYSFINFSIYLFFKYLNIFYFNQILTKLNYNKNLKLYFFLMFFSLGGLPPFLGFMPKWLTINFLLNQNLWFISLILITFSLITLFFYLRLSLSSLILNHTEIYQLAKINKSMFLSIFNLLNLLGLMFIISIFYFI